MFHPRRLGRVRCRTASIRSANSMRPPPVAPFSAIAADGCIGPTKLSAEGAGRQSGGSSASANSGARARGVGQELHRTLLSRRADGARGRPPSVLRMPARRGEGVRRRLPRRKEECGRHGRRSPPRTARWAAETLVANASRRAARGRLCRDRRPSACASRRDSWPWSFSGYGPATPFAANAEADVLTPRSTVAALAAGYRPVWDLAAGSAA